MLHHHVHLIAVLFFLLGDALHALAQVDAVARATGQKRRKVVYDRWVPFVVRGAISAFLFVGILDGQIDDLLNSTGATLPSWLDKLLGLQVDQGWLAGLFGYAFDSALGYIPALQKLGVPPPVEAPPAPPPPPTTKGTIQ